MNSKLFGLAVVFLAVALATGTSALSAISAHRTADLHVENDEDAYLQMTPHIGPNGYYAEEDQYGHLAITIDRINSNSTSYFDNVFNITNNGTQPMKVWLADNDTGIGGTQAGNADLSEKNDHPDRVHWYNDANRTDSIEGESNAVNLSVGETLQVGVRTNTLPVKSNGEYINESTNLVEQIHINAKAVNTDILNILESDYRGQNNDGDGKNDLGNDGDGKNDLGNDGDGKNDLGNDGDNLKSVIDLYNINGKSGIEGQEVRSAIKCYLFEVSCINNNKLSGDQVRKIIKKFLFNTEDNKNNLKDETNEDADQNNNNTKSIVSLYDVNNQSGIEGQEVRSAIKCYLFEVSCINNNKLSGDQVRKIIKKFLF